MASVLDGEDTTAVTDLDEGQQEAFVVEELIEELHCLYDIG